MRAKQIILLISLLLLSLSLSAQQCEHIVQRGEDFNSIAAKYSITVEELQKANPESKACYAGRKLLIPFHGQEVKRNLEVPQYDYQLTSSSNSILTRSVATTYQVGYANWKKGKYDAAYQYLLSAAQQSEPRAYYPLGDCYTQESLENHSDKTAMEWFTKAVAEIKNKSSQDYYMSCLRLADCYANAKGTGKDIQTARYYYKLYSESTTEKNNKLAKQTLATIKHEEEIIAKAEREKKMQEQREKEKRIQEQRAKENTYIANVKQNAQGGANTTPAGTSQSVATVNIQECAEKGLMLYRCEQYKEAIPYLEQAAQGGNGEAMYFLGIIYENGYGVEKNLYTASQWYFKSAESGYADSYFHAGIMSENGIGCQIDLSKAQQWYYKGMLAKKIICELCYKDLQKGKRNYYNRSINNNSYSNTQQNTTPPPPPTQPEKQTRIIGCTWCNGTGFEIRNISCHLSIFGECYDINCKVCGQRHCHHQDSHKSCIKCGGTGKIKQKLISGTWCHVYE